MRVLHIVSWYPNIENSKEAIWIKRHITSLEVHVEGQFVLHIQVKPSEKFNLNRTRSKGLIQRILQVPFKSWFLIELFSTIFLSYYLIKLKVQKRFDIINFHIAYPLLTYWHLIKRFIKIPVVITEHWSAYHFQFNVSEPEKLKRIKRVFQQRIPVIAVSDALKRDILKFSENSLFPINIVPNIVSQKFTTYSLGQAEAGSNTFFMISGWKWPKRPDIVIEAFAGFIKEKEKDYFLRIGGYGPLLPEMKKQVAELGLINRVTFLGKLDSTGIAEEMRAANAFLHCSEYETFSVVCAEALCAGCPVIASGVGGITELVNSGNGILVEKNEQNYWKDVLNEFSYLNMNREKIANEAIKKFSSMKVGKYYYHVLEEILNKNSRRK